MGAWPLLAPFALVIWIASAKLSGHSFIGAMAGTPTVAIGTMIMGRPLAEVIIAWAVTALLPATRKDTEGVENLGFDGFFGVRGRVCGRFAARRIACACRCRIGHRFRGIGFRSVAVCGLIRRCGFGRLGWGRRFSGLVGVSWCRAEDKLIERWRCDRFGFRV